MPVYFSSRQISESFARLASNNGAGKTHLERTSGLLYFLSFDCLCQQKDCSSLDFDPESSQGKANRKAIELEFSKLVLLKVVYGNITQVLELGQFSRGTKDPAKRISSNFLTVPLKKASEQSAKFGYPKRPAPLLEMGVAATGTKWGIQYHKDWSEHLPRFLSQTRGATPFMDLAIFVMRDTQIENEKGNVVDNLKSLILKRFSKQLSEFWIARLEKEKVFASHFDNPYSLTHDPFAKSDEIDPLDRFKGHTKEELGQYIIKLETLLESNKISFPNKLKR
jgi:hypothetical protein